MNKFAVSVLAAIILAFAAPGFAKDSDEAIVSGRLGGRIDQAVQRSTGGGFWGAVLVSRGGEILLAKGYGFSDYSSRPNTPRTLFEIASASKQFTAAAIMVLVEQKKLKTTTKLGSIFADVPRDKQGITVHQLLTHTSGISPRVGVPYTSPLDRSEYVPEILEHPLASDPGDKFAYSNAGYALLAAIVETVSAETFELFMLEEVFSDARLVDTGFIGEARLIKSGRDSSRLGDGQGSWTAANWHWGWGYRGMGGVVTTVLDLHRWDRALRTKDVLSRMSLKRMHTPELSNYGYGWRVETTPRGTTKVSHGGGVKGFGCYLTRYLEDDAFVAVLSNGKTNVAAVTKTITDILYPPVRVTAVLDVTPYELSEHRAAELEGDLRWSANREDAGVVMSLMDRKHVPLRIRMPPGYEANVLAGLESGIRARLRDDPGGKAAVQAGIYFSKYPPGKKRVELTEKLDVVVRPQYEGRDESGKPVVDRRIILILQDGKHGMWSTIVRMNVAAARELAGAIRGAMK